MTPEFAQAVDPVFLHVLRLAERIDGGENLAPAEVKRGIEVTLNQAESVLRRSKDWEIAKYGLIAWIDDTLINSNWEHRGEWLSDYLFEVDLYGPREAFDKFYKLAAEAKRLSTSDALEVFYICVVLGFRGMYGDAETAEIPEGLPATLEAWTQETGKAIRTGKGLPPIVGNPQPSAGVPALRGYSTLVWTSLTVFGVTILTMMVVMTMVVLK